MADPQTANVGLYQPTRGSDAGTWDSPVNANTGAADSLFSNVSVIPLTNSPVTLTTPPNSGAAWSGPYQSQSAVIAFTGVLTADVTVTFPRPGFWIINNLCTGPHNVILRAASLPGVICAPQGGTIYIFVTGNNVIFVNMGFVGQYLFLGASSVPSWITGCTVPPYLNCDGTTFNATTYPALNTTLGGNTLPDLRGRVFASLNQGTGRIVASGINGNALLSAGGADTETIGQVNLPAINWSVADTRVWQAPFQPTFTATPGGFAGSGATSYINPGLSSNVPVVSGSLTVSSGGGGAALPTMPPAAIGGLIMIRAG